MRTRSFCRWNVLNCLKSEPKYSLQGKNNLGARNTQSIFEYSCHFSEVALQVIWLALQCLWLRNTRAGTRTPACKHGKKTIPHLRIVILNKCPQLGI